MEEFTYNTYEKIITWRKNSYNIIAETKAEADEAMKKAFKDNELYPGIENNMGLSLTPFWMDYCDYYEADEDIISYEDNNFNPTEELYNDEGELLDDNTPIEIKRDKIITSILNEKEVK